MDLNNQTKKENCCGCGVCKELCPVHDIQFREGKDGFLYPYAKMTNCTHCNLCISCCPMKPKHTENYANQYLGARASSEEWRALSSSGGVFQELAKYVIRQGGIVIGAAFDDSFVLKHQVVTAISELPKLLGAKYIQSRQENNIYEKLKGALVAGKWVLYSGTPCYCEGMLNYVNARKLPAEKLILLDFVCYGVPSPGMWQDYISYIQKKQGEILTGYRFREKSQGNHGRFISYEFQQKPETKYIVPMSQELYCSLYFGNYSIRPSCHHCPFTTVKRNSDFTIGDFWGIEHVKPEFDDGRGISMVILHSEKAKRLWDRVSNQFDWFFCEEKDVLQKEQPRLETPTAPASKRGIFYFLYQRIPFSVLVRLLWNGKRLRWFWRWNRKKVG